MSESQILIEAPSQQTAINVGAPAQGGRSTRAYKVAGLTVLACVLVMSQTMIVYFLVSQRGDIKSLEEQSSDLGTQLTRGRSASLPIQVPSFNDALTFDYGDEESSSGFPERTVPPQGTQCQLEAAGLKPERMPFFRMECDEHGLYRPHQCFEHHCWCVNPANGEEIPGSLRNGPVTCNKAVYSGGLRNVSVPDVDM